MPSLSDLSTFTGSWTLRPDQTSIEFHTKALWVLPVTGTAKATGGGGTVTAEGGLTGTLVIDAGSIQTGVGRRDAHLKTADFFDVAEHPTITFAATAARPVGDDRLEISGSLEIHGEARPLTVPAELAVDGEAVTLVAEVPIDRSEWGLTATPLGAGLKNRVVIRARFERA